MPVGPSPRAAPPIRFESVAISTSYPKFVNNLLAAKHCQGRRPISLTSRSLSRTILASAEGKSSIHRHAFSRFELEVSLKLK